MKFKGILLCFLLAFILIIPSPSITQTRDSGKVYKVAILPFLIHSQENLDYLREGIYDILTSRITVEGKIVVIERSIVERALYEEKPMRLDETAATKIGMRAGADYIVLGSLTKIGNYISLDARLISLTEEKPPLTAFTQHKGIDDVMVKIGDFAQDIGYKILGRRTMVGRPGEPRQRKGIERFDRMDMDFKRSQTSGFEIKGLDIGDVDGDKKNEVVIMDEHNLYVFKYDGEKLTLFQKIETGYQYTFLTLDVADVNRNGVAEIIVTAVVEDDVRSFILEYEQGKFRKITEKSNWFFRVLDHPKDGPTLMGQRRGSEGIAVGPIYKFIWQKKSFEKGPKLPFPKETNIFGLALANIRDKDKSDFIVLDDLDRLRIVDQANGKYLWSSGDHFGGSNNFYDTWKKKDLDYRVGTAPVWRVYIPGRIVTKDLDGDGFYEVIINQNSSSGTKLFDRVRKFNKGVIYNLAWDDTALAPNWKTREINGYISDFQMKDVDNDGEEELVIAVVLPPEEGVEGIFSKKSRSNIHFFKIF
jgi:TolB-like protein